MKNLMHASLTTLLLLAVSAGATPASDIQAIRPLLPAGTDVAQVQASLMRGSNEADAFEAGKTNYLIRDINGDGLTDVLVISEEQPRFETYNDGKPCASDNEPDCHLAFGKRALRLFYGQVGGAMKLAFTNDKMILGGDDGGVFGDPLEGFTVTPRGNIQYAVYGGSAWRWSYTDTFQFRGGELVVIGSDSYSGWTGDLRADTKSINLITGQVIETHQKNAEAPVRTKKYRIPVQPLVKVADFAGSNVE